MIEVKAFNNTYMKSCSYCIYDDNTKEAYIVDPGDSECIMAFVSDKSLHPQGIFITHCHIDHVYGLNEVHKAYPQAKIYCSEETYKGIKNERINMSYIFSEDEFVTPEMLAYTFVSSTLRIICFGHPIVIMETPGHDIDCLTYIIGRNIFTGDCYSPDIQMQHCWFRSNKSEAKASEQRIISVINQYDLNVYAGHYK